MHEAYSRTTRARGLRAARKTKARREEDAGAAENKARDGTIHTRRRNTTYVNILRQQRQYRMNTKEKERKRKGSEAGTVPPRRRSSAQVAGPRRITSQGRDNPGAGIEPKRGEEMRRRRDKRTREMTVLLSEEETSGPFKYRHE